MSTARAATVAALSVLLCGCDNVLDLKDLEAVNEADVWNDPDLAEAYVNRIYLDNLPGWSTGEANQSDESPGATNFMYGQLTENSVNYWPYGQIRRINILLDEIDIGTIDDALKSRLKGEAYFFRAWQYWEMTNRYGGVPLVLEPAQLTDSLLVERAATSEVIRQIVSDLDQAIELLPAIGPGAANDGHVHKGTAMALKGRVLLYYASPQFNRPGDVTRWQAAYDANLAAKDYLASKGFALYPDFEQLWFQDMNPEAIFVRRYSYPLSTHNWAAATRPLDESQGTTGANRPTLELVRVFPMRDGRPITNHPAYDSIYFWKNRDPRFRATIAYNGAVWELSGKSGRRQWTYVGGEANNPTLTGFYSRKAVNPRDDAFQAFNGNTQWIEIRFAEVLLNLAESANAIGKTQEAYDQIIALRQRAKIDPGDGLYGLDPGMTKEQMQQAIMLERQIEFAYEGKRYWDLRRNMLFESLLNGTRRRGVRITLKIPATQWIALRDTVNLDTRYHEFFATSIVNLDTQQAINWRENYYFFGIPKAHIDLNKNLQQTNGWAGGTFDPLR
jgi:hypothetical protein